MATKLKIIGYDGLNQAAMTKALHEYTELGFRGSKEITERLIKKGSVEIEMETSDDAIKLYKQLKYANANVYIEYKNRLQGPPSHYDEIIENGEQYYWHLFVTLHKFIGIVFALVGFMATLYQLLQWLSSKSSGLSIPSLIGTLSAFVIGVWLIVDKTYSRYTNEEKHGE